MKRSLIVLLAFAVSAMADEEKLLKNVDGHHGTLVEKFGREEGSRVSAEVAAQQKRYEEAKKEGNLLEAARLTPFGHVEANMYNAHAKNTLDDLDEELVASIKDVTNSVERAKAADTYYKSEAVVATLNRVLEWLDLAEKASKAARASDYRTVSLDREQVVEKLDKVDEYITSNRLYTQRCLGQKPWPKQE
jgi:hypothetical protein